MAFSYIDQACKEGSRVHEAEFHIFSLLSDPACQVAAILYKYTQPYTGSLVEIDKVCRRTRALPRINLSHLSGLDIWPSLPGKFIHDQYKIQQTQ